MTRYDYDKQCWTIQGIIQSCAHPDAMRCDCYGRLHAGECITCGHRPLLPMEAWNMPGRLHHIQSCEVPS